MEHLITTFTSILYYILIVYIISATSIESCFTSCTTTS